MSVVAPTVNGIENFLCILTIIAAQLRTNSWNFTTPILKDFLYAHTKYITTLYVKKSILISVMTIVHCKISPFLLVFTVALKAVF